MRRRGITLIELLVAAVMFAIIAGALGKAFAFALEYQTNAPKTRAAQESQVLFEDKLRRLIQSAYLAPTATGSPADPNSYFVGTSGNQGLASPSSSGSSSPPSLGQAAGTQTNVNVDTGQPSDGIVFTAGGTRVSPAYLASTETDFQTLNETYGSQGGLAEISISSTAVGDAGEKTGLFIREQRPADSDFSQGGYERVLNANVKTIAFEFFNGTDWITTWNTTSGAPGQHRLPAAVRVTYTLVGSEDTNHVLVIQIPLSDVTPQNPVSSGGTSGAATPTPTGGGIRTTANLALPVLPAISGLSGDLSLFDNLKVVPEAEATPNEETATTPNESVEGTPATLGDAIAKGLAGKGLEAHSTHETENPAQNPEPEEGWHSWAPDVTTPAPKPEGGKP